MQVIKRNGKLEDFNFVKIADALKKAPDMNNETVVKVTSIVTDQILKLYETPTVEQIQDLIETTLISLGHVKTARAFIVYRENRAKIRANEDVFIKVNSSVDEYLERADWRVNANANQGYSLGGLILNISGKITANYWLSHIYPEEVGNAHRSGDFYIHDLDMLAGYCAGWSLKTLLHEGLNGVPSKVEANPPKHLRTALGQMVNFLGILQNEWAGAQAFSSADTYLAPYVRKDNLSYKEVKQQMQEFIYNLNVPARWGSQTPFTNLTFDWNCPEDYMNQHPIIAGEEMSFTYGDLKVEMDMINRAYLEVMTEGDAKGRLFTFPIPTYNITEDFPWDDENADLLFEMTAKYGLPYFQNFINSSLKPGQIRSMCCRLQLDLRQLLAKGNGLFGSAEQTGSIGVVTLNCARLGYLFKGDRQGMLKRLDELLEFAKVSLELKRKTIQHHMDNGLFPYTKHYLGTLRNHFSTIGVNGVNEMIRNFSNDKHDLTDKYGQVFAEEFLDIIREKLLKFQDETGHMYNLEATPAEGATYRLAKEDKKRFPDILQAGSEEAPYYTNSSQLPVGFTDDPILALDLQEKLQGKYTGGTVVHLYMAERISSSKVCKELVKRVLTNYRIPYITITPTFSICPKHGYVAGEHEFCPLCDEELLTSK